MFGSDAEWKFIGRLLIGLLLAGAGLTVVPLDVRAAIVARACVYA